MEKSLRLCPCTAENAWKMKQEGADGATSHQTLELANHLRLCKAVLLSSSRKCQLFLSCHFRRLGWDLTLPHYGISKKTASVLHSWCYTNLISIFVQWSTVTSLFWAEEESQLKTTKCIKFFLNVCRLNKFFLVAVNECQIFVEIKKTTLLSVSIFSVLLISC